jgi:coronin-1B/1C/6
LERQGKQPTGMPMITGHKAAIMEAQWSPFNDNMIVTSSEDTKAMLWVIPDGGLKENATVPARLLGSHKRKVGTVTWHNSAANILATSGTDPNVKIWDIEAGKDLFTQVDHTDIINDLQWNFEGSWCATSCKDKHLRIIDPRTQKLVADVTEAHPGIKGFRLQTVWNPKEWIITCGFSKSSERVASVWDVAKMDKPINSISIDNAAGALMPFMDNDLGILYLAGKGDGNIRYYELVDDETSIYYLSEYKSSTSQCGMGWVPKRGLNIETCEVARLMKATPTSVEPIPMVCPRKGDTFQDDLYPPTPGPEPAISAADYAAGQNAPPKLLRLEPGVSRVVGGAGLGEQPVSASSSSSSGGGEEVAALKARVSELESQLAEAHALIAKLQASS